MGNYLGIYYLYHNYFQYYLLYLENSVKRIKIKHDYKMSKFEAEKMHEVDEMKSRFFANISHEFRTPLTLILGISKKIFRYKAKDQVFKDECWHNKKKRNQTQIPHGLVNQLLDLSKLESGNMTLGSNLTSKYYSITERISVILCFISC